MVIDTHLCLQKILKTSVFLLQVVASTYYCVLTTQSCDLTLTQKWTQKLPHNGRNVLYLIF